MPTNQQVKDEKIRYREELNALGYHKSISEAKIKTYWMIHRSEESNVRYASKEVYFDKNEALADIVALSDLNPGKTFYLLETIQVFRTKLPSSDPTLEFVELGKPVNKNHHNNNQGKRK